MYKQENIEDSILATLREINGRLPSEKKIEVSKSTPLFGMTSKLDSLGLVNLLIGLEEKISDNYGISITLTDESVLSPVNSPLESPVTLARHITALLNSKNNE